ncbi:MAG: metallophosphoesterase [Cytophagales bacterium]|nr:metallophosphoesterase [Cytophagales bacterium]
MKIISVPDIHGKPCWKNININDFDLIIFLGDYVDSDTISRESIVENLLEIIELKKQYNSKVVLLMGNHDAQYRYFPHYGCSEIDMKIQEQLTQIYQENKELFCYAFQIDRHVWTHAGISNSWFKRCSEAVAEFSISEPLDEIADIINQMAKSRHIGRVFSISLIRGGYEQFGGVVWSDKSETETDHLTGIHQYAGHNRVKEITKFGDNYSSIHYLDCLDSKEEYFILDL